MSDIGSGDHHLDGLKITYPNRKPLPEKEDNETGDILVDEAELFDCYVR